MSADTGNYDAPLASQFLLLVLPSVFIFALTIYVWNFRSKGGWSVGPSKYFEQTPTLLAAASCVSGGSVVGVCIALENSHGFDPGDFRDGAILGGIMGFMLATQLGLYAVRFRFIVIALISSALAGSLIVSPVGDRLVPYNPAMSQTQLASVVSFAVFLLVGVFSFRPVLNPAEEESDEEIPPIEFDTAFRA